MPSYLLTVAASIFFSAVSVSAQELSLPLNHDFGIEVHKALAKSETAVNTGFKPLLISRLKSAGLTDSVAYERSSIFFKQKPQNIFLRKIFFEDFVRVESPDFSLAANPLFYLEMKQDNESGEKFTVNTRGIEVKGRLGEKIAYYTTFRENQAFFPNALDSFTDFRNVVPGQGAYKPFQDSGYDYSSAEAYLSYSPFDFLNVRLGHGKHFIGEGYRSVLLSDNAFSYPFLEFSLTNKGWQYSSFIAQAEDFEQVFYNYHRRKHLAVNYLSYNYKNKFEIGLFEGLLYQSLDTLDYTYSLPWNFFTPVPLVRTLANWNSAEHYVLTGIQAKIQPVPFFTLYGQIAGSPAAEGNAFQGGVKIHDLMFDMIPGHNFFVQAEFNKAQDNLYAHASEARQSWSHYNQEMAHPAGTNFTEYLFRAQYRFNRLLLNAKHIRLTSKGQQSQIFIPLAGRDNLSETAMNLKYTSVETAYIINPAYQLQVFLGGEMRHTDNQSDKYLFFGLRTGLINFYRDFI